MKHTSPTADRPPAIPVPTDRAGVAARIPRQAGRDRRRTPRGRSGSSTAAWPPDPANAPRWRLQQTPGGVVVLGAGTPPAGARISVERELTVIELWSDPGSTPGKLTARLVGQVFTHPDVRAHPSLLVCVPSDDTTAITEVLRRLPGARARGAGATCLIEGRIS